MHTLYYKGLSSPLFVMMLFAENNIAYYKRYVLNEKQKEKIIA
jgi:hypothetical protein